MINFNRRNLELNDSRSFHLLMFVLLAFLLVGCGEVDDSDGTVVNTVALPTDDTIPLDLYCADIGLFIDNCILDDPARTLPGDWRNRDDARASPARDHKARRTRPAGSRHIGCLD